MSGVLAGFRTEEAMEQAFIRLDAAGLPTETYSPHLPQHARSRSPVPAVMLISGLVGAGGFFFLQCWALIFNYPFDIGGRPLLSWPAYMPLTFEGGVLLAIFAGFAGFLVTNRLPHLYDPIDEIDAFRAASRDTYFVAVRADDQERIRQARELLRALHPLLIEDFPP